MKNTVLVIDDLPIIRDPIAATLAAAGYQALCAGNGMQGLKMIRDQRVDLILLDVKMPVMDGLAFLRVIRGDSLTAAIPVIMLSGAEDRQDVLQAAKLGIRGYMLKSQFSLKDLLARVTQHFGELPGASTPIAPGLSTTDCALPDLTNGITKPADATMTRSGAPRTPDEMPSLISREQCIERATRALHGRTLSGVVAEVISLTASPRSNTSDLTAMIARDPLLSARVLQVANSAAYASRGTISTLSEAVRNIGSAAVRNIAAALGVFNAMPVSDSDGLNLLRCWQHAFAVATLCNRLSTQHDAGLAYLIGLCHDLGEILFHSEFSEEYRRVLEIEKSTGRARDEVEKTVIGMSHGEVLQTIVKCLGLPDSISAPIGAYHATGPGGSDGNPLTQLLRAADLYANGMLLSSSNQSPIRPIACADINAVTGGHGNPPRLDRAAMRGEILSLTATLSRFSQKQQAEVMTAPYARRAVRIWLARDPLLSSLDPVEAALELLAQVTPRDALPNEREAAEHQAIVVMAHSTSASGFDATRLHNAAARPNGKPLPILWLVGRIDGALCDPIPSLWPIPVAKLAEFVATAGIA